MYHNVPQCSTLYTLKGSCMSCFASGVTAADALPLAADALPALCIVVDLSILKHQSVCRAVNFYFYWLLGMNQVPIHGRYQSSLSRISVQKLFCSQEWDDWVQWSKYNHRIEINWIIVWGLKMKKHLRLLFAVKHRERLQLPRISNLHPGTNKSLARHHHGKLHWEMNHSLNWWTTRFLRSNRTWEVHNASHRFIIVHPMESVS